MSHMGHRRLISGVAVATALAAFALPAAAARAATYTVAPTNGPCQAPGDLACGSLTEAATAAAAGDIFNVAAATYTENPVFTVGGVTIAGQPGVLINGTITFSGATGATSKLHKVIVNRTDGEAAAIEITGAAGLEVSDAVVISKNGHGIFINAGASNKIVRSVVFTSGAETGAVRVSSPNLSTATKGVTVESSLLTGGRSGMLVTTGESAGSAASMAGAVTIVLRHVTSAGSTNGLVLDASLAAPATGAAVGNITATVTDSIITNGTAKNNYKGIVIPATLILPEVVVASPNVVSDTYTRTLQGNFDQNTVFADAAKRNFRLRPTATTAIDQGGVTAGESATDLDGEARPGPTTDLGADEFVNAAPVAKIAVRTAKPKTAQAVAFDASGSTDRETSFGGGIAQYKWDFGDGKTETTAGPTVSHTYADEGAKTIKLTVVDRQSAPSAEVSTAISLTEGVPPGAVIAKPTRNQKVKLSTLNKKTKKRKKNKISFGGLVKDNKSGVAFVIISLEKLPSTSTAKPAAATSSKCAWFDAKKGLIKKSCTKPVLLVAKLDKKAGTWTYGLSTKVKQPSAGSYRVSVYAVDGAGNFGNTAEAKNRVIRFTLVK